VQQRLKVAEAPISCLVTRAITRLLNNSCQLYDPLEMTKDKYNTSNW